MNGIIRLQSLIGFVALTMAFQASAQEQVSGRSSETVLSPIVLEDDHGYTEPVLESQAWVVTFVNSGNDERRRVLTPIEEVATHPGSTILYELAIVNPTEEVLTNVSLVNNFPSELRFLPGSIAGPQGLKATYSVDNLEEEFVLVPRPDESVRNGQPSLDDLETIHFMVQAVPVNTRVLVSYSGDVRQGPVSVNN